jgi:hypothetical protein
MRSLEFILIIATDSSNTLDPQKISTPHEILARRMFQEFDRAERASDQVRNILGLSVPRHYSNEIDMLFQQLD